MNRLDQASTNARFLQSRQLPERPPMRHLGILRVEALKLEAIVAACKDLGGKSIVVSNGLPGRPFSASILARTLANNGIIVSPGSIAWASRNNTRLGIANGDLGEVVQGSQGLSARFPVGATVPLDSGFATARRAISYHGAQGHRDAGLNLVALYDSSTAALGYNALRIPLIAGNRVIMLCDPAGWQGIEALDRKPIAALPEVGLPRAVVAALVEAGGRWSVSLDGNPAPTLVDTDRARRSGPPARPSAQAAAPAY